MHIQITLFCNVVRIILRLHTYFLFDEKLLTFFLLRLRINMHRGL